jgi:hypothetical protein
MLRDAFRFPVGTPAARRDLLVGGLLLLTTLPGWILNLGHRLECVHHLTHRDPQVFRGFRPLGFTFGHGLRSFTAICTYLAPSLLAGGGALLSSGPLRMGLAVLAGLLFCLAVFVLPGGMTWYAAYRDASYLVRPDRALRRAVGGGRAYLKAWGIALAAISLSFLGLAALGVGFLFTSVWAWSVVGYAFSRALILDRVDGGSGARPSPR